MAALRFLAGLFALIAIIALVADATPWLNGSGPFAGTSFETQWERISPNSLAAARERVSAGVSPAVWSAIEAVVIGFPTWAVFGALALITGTLGRRRRRVNIFVN
ncbi:MAG: hypothetical protein B7Y80_03170 [Hyphomicrobium sp. 32-62-53]|nr:MAG: hypothetical protein B7Y80_03170 [Hyphomicrobium sp. 32-62-53]